MFLFKHFFFLHKANVMTYYLLILKRLWSMLFLIYVKLSFFIQGSYLTRKVLTVVDN